MTLWQGYPACARALKDLRAVFAGLCLAFPAAQVLAQSGEGGLIQLPDLDTGFALEAPIMEDVAQRFNPARRVADLDDAARTDRDIWVSPLRLTDLRYPVRDGIARISGEREWVNFDVYADQSAGQNLLRLSTVSGINNLPERSFMRVSLNGTELGQRNLEFIENFGALDLALPSGLLKPGRNQVQIEFRQHHRIFCGPEAAFDLWTEIDLTRSGLVVRRDGLDVGIESFLMALAAQASGVRPVEIRGLDALGSEAAHWRAFLVGRLNHVLAGAPVVFRFGDHWTVEDTRPANARITILPAATSRLSFVTGGDGAQVMVLEVAQGTRPESLLGDLPQFTVTTSDLRAPLILPQDDVPLSHIGMRTENFTQHYALRHHVFRLPDDWLVLTAAKARLNLDYAYANNLPQGAMLLLSVNGTSIRLLPLRGEGGVPITAFPIDFEARLMHPGNNMLSFEMFVPGDPANLPCPTAEAPVLTISETSTLRVPFSPSMSIPDMDLAFATLSPESLRANELTRRAFSETDVLTLSAALTHARAAFRPSTLHLMAIDDLGSIPTATHRPDRRLLEDTVLLMPQEEILVANAVDPYFVDPFAARRQAPSQPFSAALTRGWDEAKKYLFWVRDRIFTSEGDQLNTWLATQRGQAVLFQLDPERPDEIWMLRNPQADIHTIALAIANARSSGVGPKGQVSVLSHEGYWINWFAPDRRPILLEPWSVENFRAAMGNFVSARPIFYTIMVLSLALISALIALRLVISTREHKV